MIDTDNLENQLRERYKEFLKTQSVNDNLERLEWAYCKSISPDVKVIMKGTKEEIIIEYIQGYDPTGVEDDTFRDWLKERRGNETEI